MSIQIITIRVFLLFTKHIKPFWLFPMLLTGRGGLWRNIYKLQRSGNLEAAACLATRISRKIAFSNASSFSKPCTGPKDLWERVNKITGRNKTSNTSKQYDAETLDKHYASFSTDSHYVPLIHKLTVSKFCEFISEEQIFRLLDAGRSTASGMNGLRTGTYVLRHPSYSPSGTTFQPVTQFLECSTSVEGRCHHACSWGSCTINLRMPAPGCASNLFLTGWGDSVSLPLNFPHTRNYVSTCVGELFSPQQVPRHTPTSSPCERDSLWATT